MVIGVCRFYATGYYLYGTWIVPGRYLQTTGYLPGSIQIPTWYYPDTIAIVSGRLQTTTDYDTPIDFQVATRYLRVSPDYSVFIRTKFRIPGQIRQLNMIHLNIE
ncbi:unnamed protein product [Caenorhabditis auriculariae]|uniref:Uncharacterized protein n=1 Tax=Caenorhabditis auriculariae TaxID=2777116 RepID=A0A8S1HL78_9PELO|nr:unnamed protein product [Caenorhabditis auriculariae]